MRALIGLCRSVFEYDPDKSAANKRKHGIDFDEAQAVWDGVTITVPSHQASHGEQRHLAIGEIGGKRWAVIFTDRDTVIRIISARRARPLEEYLYEQARQNR